MREDQIYAFVSSSSSFLKFGGHLFRFYKIFIYFIDYMPVSYTEYKNVYIISYFYLNVVYLLKIG